MSNPNADVVYHRCMLRTNIYLEDAQVALLDRQARSVGLSRSQLIRNLIDTGLDNSGAKREQALDILDQTFGMAPDIQPPFRGSDRRQDHLDQMWQL